MGLAAATSEVEIQVKRRVGRNDPRGRPPFFQGVRSLDPSFYLLSRGAQAAVLHQRNVV